MALRDLYPDPNPMSNNLNNESSSVLQHVPVSFIFRDSLVTCRLEICCILIQARSLKIQVQDGDRGRSEPPIRFRVRFRVRVRVTVIYQRARVIGRVRGEASDLHQALYRCRFKIQDSRFEIQDSRFKIQPLYRCTMLAAGEASS